jgi:DNA-directed RNA polymerase specialized sigma24 family protein
MPLEVPVRAVIQKGEPIMTPESSETIELCRRIERGDETALLELFARHRDRLRRMIKLRLDRRLQGRLDPSDVLQEAYLGATPLGLSPDGTRLIAATNRQIALIWYLRRIRQQLGAMDLDWDQPPFPQADAAASTPPPIRSICIHRLGQPAQARDAFDRAVHWLHEQKQLPAEYPEVPAGFRAEAEAVLARRAADLPDDVFAGPPERIRPTAGMRPAGADSHPPFGHLLPWGSSAGGLLGGGFPETVAIAG